MPIVLHPTAHICLVILLLYCVAQVYLHLPKNLFCEAYYTFLCALPSKHCFDDVIRGDLPNILLQRCPMLLPSVAERKCMTDSHPSLSFLSFIKQRSVPEIIVHHPQQEMCIRDRYYDSGLLNWAV